MTSVLVMEPHPEMYNFIKEKLRHYGYPENETFLCKNEQTAILYANASTYDFAVVHVGEHVGHDLLQVLYRKQVTTFATVHSDEPRIMDMAEQYATMAFSACEEWMAEFEIMDQAMKAQYAYRQQRSKWKKRNSRRSSTIVDRHAFIQPSPFVLQRQ